MKTIIVENYDEMSKLSAKMLADCITEQPAANICLPTGGSVDGTYEELCALTKKEKISFKDIHSYNMDEYVGLSKTNDQGYYYYLNDKVYSKTDINIQNTFSPDACATNLQTACKEYTDKIKNLNGFDYILLGIGTDGHIAFNMPKEDCLDLDTHIEDLTQETINANARFFNSTDEVPKQAMTIGVGLILESKKIVLVASGKAKADAIAQFLNRRVADPKLPASMLWFHKDVTIILDKEAASKLQD